MKKIIVMCIALLFIVGCSRGRTDSAAKEGFLYDLDHMMQILEENFALFDVAYWARGIDISQLADNARAEVIASTEINEEIFHTILRSNFLELFHFAHFFIDPSPRTALPFSADDADENEIQELAEIAMGFGLNEYNSFAAAEEFHVLRTQPELLQGMQEWLVMRYGEEFTSRIVRAVEGGDFADFLQTTMIVRDIAEQGLISTDIIEPGRIAYMIVRAPMPVSATEYQSHLAEFFNEVGDYEHLIIDLRGNFGGWPMPFFDLIIRPIIRQPVTAEGFMFMGTGGFQRASRRHEESRFGMTSGRVSSVYEILNNVYLPEINKSDMERMGYGFPFSIELTPRLPLGVTRGALSATSFEGKILLLTDERVGSAAQMITWVVQETGFATIVGEITGGNYGGPRSSFVLPNSLIRITLDVFYVTDSFGRPLEAGTIPHHFNRPGMDALETVLQLIEEGNY